MKQKKIGTTLYVFETSAYEITKDTDAKEICIQQEDLEAFIKLNQAIANKMQPYNYSLLTVKKTIWADYIDAPDIYSITLTGDSGELVEVSAESSEAGETITVTPKTGYTVANVNVTSSEVEVIPGETNWTFTMPESDVVLLAAIDTHLINTEGDSSAVTVSDNQAKDGDVVTITPTQGLSTINVELSSDEVNFNTGESGWTFVMPDEDVTISVTLKAYNITAAGDSSYITVANSAKVGSTVTVTPANGATMNTISIVVSGGVEVTAGAEAYTFTMPGNDVTVTATLASHTITTDGDDTYISVANSAKSGDTVEVTPANGANVDNVSIVVSGGVEVTKGVSSYTFTMPNNNVTVTATAASYSITRSGDSNYYVVENTAKMGTTVEVVPTNGATVDTISFSATGITFVKGVDSYTFTMPMENVTITGTLATHSISTDGDDTYMTVSNNTAKLGQVVSVTPINGATMSTLSIAISGVTVTAGTTAYLFIMPNEDITITATLASFNISTAGDSSYISAPSSAKMFSTVEVTPTNGADMSSVSITVSGDIPVTTGTTSYTFTMPANDVTVNATYVEPHHDYSQDYLTFTAVHACKFIFTEAGSGNSLEYSLDNGTTWTSLASDTASPTVNENGKIIWRGQRTSPSNTGIGTFSTTGGEFVASGNVLSLLNGDNFRNVTTLTDNKVFYRLFKSCAAMTNAENLVLPATTLTANCYQSMFEACTGLSIGPALPATTLAANCYQDMYYGCVSLTTAPALPATTLATGCYQSMFNGGCTSLTTPPALPATTLTMNCYQSMFRKSGLTTAPALPAKTLANNCYQYMFRECTSLTTAPALPATTLTNSCYQNMFYGCTILNYVECLATNISASGCVSNWLYNVAATGTFIKSESMTSWASGASGIPNGWTVQNPTQYAITVTGDTSYVNIPSTAGGDSIVTITPINGATRRHLTITISGDIPVIINGADFSFVMPNNTVTINVVYDSSPHDYSQDYFTLTAIEPTEFTYTSQGSGALEYSLDNGTTWVTLAPSSSTSSTYTTPTVNAGESIMFKSQKYTLGQGVGTFDSTRGRYDASGNVQSISYGGAFRPQLGIQHDSEFTKLFYNSTKLLSAEDLILSATYLKSNCYRSMFEGCTSLTTAPSLPATTLADYCYTSMFYACRALTTAPALPATTLAMSCYNSMFSNCTGLTTAPALPATTLSDYCYYNMFALCTSLTTAPALPATTLATRCYQHMFQNCTSLTTAPSTLPATTLVDYCYNGMFYYCTSLTTSPTLPATTLATGCYQNMFDSCTSLTTVPATLPATTLANYCYEQMFTQCSSLTTAPVLPATTLVDYCYNYMFNNCRNLTEITCLATDISAINCTAAWVINVNASGTFYKDASMQDWTSDFNGIPANWTVQDAA